VGPQIRNSGAFTGTIGPSTMPSPIRVAILSDSWLPGIPGPVPVTVTHGSHTSRAWAWRSGAWSVSDVEADAAPDISVTRLLDEYLGLPSPGAARPSAMATVAIPEIVECRSVLSLVDDLPRAGEVQVCESDFADDERERVLVRNGIAAWVTLVPRSHVRPGTVRLPADLLALTGAGKGSAFVIAPLPATPSGGRAQGGAARLRRGLANLRSVIGRTIELGLTWALNAPAISLRVTVAHPGDDNDDTIGVHQGALDRIGVRSGEQVIIRWGTAERTLAAITDHAPPSASASPPANDRLGPTVPALSASIPSHLVARVPGTVRHALDLPTAAVITVRRSTRSVLVSNLHRLVIPVTGLVLAGAAITDPNWWVMGSGAVVASVLALARLRIPGRR
jgi:hypothetical protein